jgi:membrane associated rhomboid family serine protease
VNLPPDTDLAHHLPPADWIPLATYSSFSSADDHALVLIATGHECWIHPQESSFLLLVPSAIAPSARDEITAYESEKVPPLSPLTENPSFRHQSAGIIHLWLILLILSFAWQTADPSLVERGLSSSHALIHQNEWWRPFTALFLHSDFPHLLGNLLGGALFGTLVVRSIGPVLGLTAILASGTLGNTLNAFFHLPEEHRSLGASTAVFGALGILAALGSIELLRHPRALPWRRIIAPLLGGLILLGWMGGGSPGSLTDVGAHIAGFLSGLGLGTLGPLISRPTQNKQNTTG